jgi:hypothetical protein
MKRLKKLEIDQVTSLIKEGKSLGYISRLTGRNKSTLYDYYKKILGKKYKDITIPENDLFIGELVGLFVGDGNLYFDKKKYCYDVRFFFNIKEETYVKELVKLFDLHFLKKPHIGRTKNVLIVRYFSKKLFNFLKEYVGWGISLDKRGANQKSRTVFLKNKDYAKDFKIGFLRGFLDSDGYLSDKKILFGSSSEAIMRQTSKFLSDLKFNKFKLSSYERSYGNRVGIWHLYVHKVERNKFFDLIHPRNLVKLNKK